MQRAESAPGKASVPFVTSLLYMHMFPEKGNKQNKPFFD